MNNLSDYLNKNRSDKCQSHTYSYVYDGVFQTFDRQSELDILESGVEYGGSLCAWKEYFPNAKVTGVDPVDARRPEYKRDDVEFILGDIKDYQTDREFDIIIEDGNHSNHDALWAGMNLSKKLKLGGILIIEDVQEAYMMPFLLWGKLEGGYVINSIDMRRITNTHDNFVIIIHKWKNIIQKTIEVKR